MYQGIGFGDVERIKLDGDFFGRAEKRGARQRSRSGEDGLLGECVGGNKLKRVEKKNPKKTSQSCVPLHGGIIEKKEIGKIRT